MDRDTNKGNREMLAPAYAARIARFERRVGREATDKEIARMLPSKRTRNRDYRVSPDEAGSMRLEDAREAFED